MWTRRYQRPLNPNPKPTETLVSVVAHDLFPSFEIMHTQCPNCRHPFQAIDVDGVMSERKLINEVLAEVREVNRLRDGIKQIISCPDYTNPELMVRRIHDLLQNAAAEAASYAACAAAYAECDTIRQFTPNPFETERGGA